MPLTYFWDWRNREDPPSSMRVLEIVDQKNPHNILHRVLIEREEKKGEWGATLILRYVQIDILYGELSAYPFSGTYDRSPDGKERVSITGGLVMLSIAALRGFHLGTYMQDEIVRWAKQWPHAQVRQISLSPVDADDNNRERRNRYYRQFKVEFDGDGKSGLSLPMLASDLAPVDPKVWGLDIVEHGLVDYMRKRFFEHAELERENQRLKFALESCHQNKARKRKCTFWLFTLPFISMILVNFVFIFLR